MIITNMKPYGVIRGLLKKRKKIGIVACNSCSRACETGGRKKLDEIAERLKADGYNVVQTNLIPMACNVDLVKKPEFNADELLILACDAAVFTFQMLFPSKKIIPALYTIGFGARDSQGNIFVMKEL